MPKEQYNFVDLFCGAGGFTEGFLLSGGNRFRYKLLLASDSHENARRTHWHRFHEQIGLDYSFLLKDIRERNFINILLEQLGPTADDVDVVIGGPPCQGFSVFGPRNQNDPRNDLFQPYLKVISALRPKYFVVENVPGLAMMYSGSKVKEIHEKVSNMAAPAYRLVGPLRVNAAAFGVPQTRERILFIGSRYDVPIVEAIKPTCTQYISSADALGDLGFLRAWESNGFYHESHPATTNYQQESRAGRLFKKLGIEREDKSLTNHEAARHTPEVIARFAMVEPGSGFESIPQSLWDAHLKSSKKWCVRLAPDKPAYTVTTLPDDFIHYKQHRILTVREWARLQSFDDTFVFLGPRASGGGGKGNRKRNGELPQYTQVGNAVPPLLASGIGDAILRTLDAKRIMNAPSRTRSNDFFSQIHTTI